MLALWGVEPFPNRRTDRIIGKRNSLMQRVIVIAGKDPTVVDGGSESYLRAYGLAAIRAGYEPHHFTVGKKADLLVTEFGVVHRVYSPFRPFRGLMVAAHQPFIVNAVDRFVGQTLDKCLIHSFGPWGGVGVAVARRLEKRGIDAITAVTAFGTYNHETRGKLRRLRAEQLTLTRLQHEWELFWTRLTVDPSERRGYRGSLVLVNYDSVRRIIERQFGSNAISFIKTRYCSESAFMSAERGRAKVPDRIAQLEPKDAPLIVAVSRHDPRKGIDVLLQALAKLKQADIAFRACLVGGGILLEKHRNLASYLELAGSTAIVGRVPDAREYVDHADIFVLPSTEEGSGSVSLLEALQARVAAVVTNIDGLPEDVTHELSALIVDPDNSESLFTALSRLLTDARLRKQIAQAGHRRYLERFSADAFSSDIIWVYSTLGFPPHSRATALLPN
jgi:glycosyltransferase involved in cell wall biosynthesis